MSAVHSSSPQKRWDRLLEDRHLNSEDLARLQQWQHDAGLLFQGQLMTRTLRPHLLDSAQLERDRTMARAVVTALVHASQCLEQDQALARRCLGDWIDRFGDLLNIDPGYPQRSVFARLDVLPTPEGPKVIEYNGTPGGIMPGDQLSVLFQQLAGQIGFDQDGSISPLLVFPAVRTAILKTYQAWGGTGDPLLIFAIPRELPGFVGMVQSTIDALMASGLSARVADPGELEFSNGRLRHQGDPVGVLIRVFLPEMIPRLGDRLHGVFLAIRAGAVCMITAFRNTLLSHKALFALITDPELDLGLSATVSEQVRTYVPWTRLLIDEPTTDPTGQRIDLLTWAIAQREQLVCKPASGYGGAGVVLGWTVEQAPWREGLEQAIRRGGFLLQQRVTLVPRIHPALAEGLPDVERYSDQNIFIADGELAGYLTRLSPTPITNMSQGASMVPSFIVSPRS
ncbi:MAG TPA: hypothetical protein DCS21_00415 [Gammaproteobacteria bacterium]|nr:hypothetical protein [Gammaproteobacteria bacterium]